ncbi:hypothetical protein HDU96_002773, partial [Phlyctochytrium bullatum]
MAPQTTHPTLDAAANPFLVEPAHPPAMPAHPASSLVSPDVQAALSRSLMTAREDVSVIPVPNSPTTVDPARAGTPGPVPTPLTRAELDGFDPLAPAAPPTPSVNPHAQPSSPNPHHLAVIKGEPEAKSFPVTPPPPQLLKSSPPPPMRSLPASAGRPRNLSHPYPPPRAETPSFVPPSPPTYHPASPSPAAHWRIPDPGPAPLPSHDAATTPPPSSPPLATSMIAEADHADDGDDDRSIKSEHDPNDDGHDDRVTSESDYASWPDLKSETEEDDEEAAWLYPPISPSLSPQPALYYSPSPPPRPAYTTARRTGGPPLPPRPIAASVARHADAAAPANPPATPPVATQPRTGETTPQFFTPLTHSPHPTTPAGDAMPPTRPHAELGHRTAKTTKTVELGPARTVAFKPAPPTPMMTRARAAALQNAAVQRTPVVPSGTPTMVTRSRARLAVRTPGLPANPPAAERPAKGPFQPLVAPPVPRPPPSDPMRGVEARPAVEKGKEPATAPTVDDPMPAKGNPACPPSLNPANLPAGLKAAPRTPPADPPTRASRKAPRRRSSSPSYDPTHASTSAAPLAPPRSMMDRHERARRQREVVKTIQERPLRSLRTSAVRAAQQHLSSAAEQHVRDLNGDHDAPFDTLDEFYRAVLTPKFFKSKARVMYDADPRAMQSYASATRRFNTFASNGLTVAESQRRVEDFKWDPRRTHPVTAETDLQLLNANSGDPLPVHELKKRYLTGCRDRRLSRRLQGAKFTIATQPFPVEWDHPDVDLDDLAARAVLERETLEDRDRNRDRR